METRDLDENMLLDVDVPGNVLALTVEHSSERSRFPGFSCEQVSAQVNEAFQGLRRT